MAGIELPVKAIREQIAGGFDLLVHIGRLVDGSRRVTQITEIAGMEGDVVTLQDLFVARAPEHGGDGTPLLGPLRSTGAPAGLPVQARRQRRRASALGVAGRRMRRTLLAARRAGRARRCPRPRRGRPAPCRSAASTLDEFPLVRVTAVVPAGQHARRSPRTAARPATSTARELGSAQAIVLAVDNSSSMTGRPLREAKRAAGDSSPATQRGRRAASSRSATRRCR